MIFQRENAMLISKIQGFNVLIFLFIHYCATGGVSECGSLLVSPMNMAHLFPAKRDPLA